LPIDQSQPPEPAERKTPMSEDWRSTWTDFPDDSYFDRTNMDRQDWRLRMIQAGLLKPLIFGAEAKVMAAIERQRQQQQQRQQQRQQHQQHDQTSRAEE